MFALRSLRSVNSKIVNSSPFFQNLIKSGMHDGNSKIGMREIVGHGINGEPQYIDSIMFPYPSIRFKEITSSLKALKEKEKGNWRSLTKEEKKCLYRLSFCQTLVEVVAPTGLWKQYLAAVLVAMSLGIWLFLTQQTMIKMTGQTLPDTFSEERRLAQLKRMLDMRVGLVNGLSARREYQKYIKKSEAEK